MNAGHVYVIAFDNGIVKVGRTQNVTNRLSVHKGDGRKFGIAVTNSWASPLHVEWELNEESLKSIAVKYGGTPTRAEYFKGTDYALVAAAAAGLPFTSPREGAEDLPLTARAPLDRRKLFMKRVRARLDRTALAKLANLDPSYIRLLELGKRGPSFKTLGLLAEVLGCGMADLMPDETDVAA